MNKQQLKDRIMNFVKVGMSVELGCDASDGEYSLTIDSFVGSLDISSPGGVDDVSLIKEAIENDMNFKNLPAECFVEILLEESGEWEDVFWHKYYIVKSTVVHELI